MNKTYQISISGQVQGVGFRPYVYSLAIKFSLHGTVSNNEDGVVIYVTGLASAVQKFYKKLLTFPPPVSKIKDSTILEAQLIKFNDFQKKELPN